MSCQVVIVESIQQPIKNGNYPMNIIALA